MMNHLFSESAAHAATGRELVVMCPLWVPYVRIGQERWTPRAKRYMQSRDALAKFIVWHANRTKFQNDDFRLFSVSVAVFLHERKSRKAGEGKADSVGAGSNSGDIDNYLKAAVDSAQVAGVISNDSPDRWLLIAGCPIFTISPTARETGVIRFCELSPERVGVDYGNALLSSIDPKAVPVSVQPTLPIPTTTRAKARTTRQG